MSQEFLQQGFKKEPLNYGIAVAAGGIILLLIAILLLLSRSCGNGEEAVIDSSPRAQPFFLAAPDNEHPETNAEQQEAAEERNDNDVVSTLPSVPPDAFRVRRTAPPPVFPTVARPQEPDPEEGNPGGGDMTGL